MPIKKKVFIKFDAGSGQSVFYCAWRMMNLEGPLTSSTFTPDLGAIEADLERYTAQMRRQQVHIDEIKRLCHVPIRD